ncbi:hypothetical protein P153DRAFT_392498 [Dothidotthia symphoricarpi CBS 119687]|uniref:Phosphatidylinositol N-acetylglucosaminyltransferase subunit H conserved domain-containing protein n=1 Tax=Dothidotthia symphoricarpi CBS 119687 TaxID=1392245 RepID=A0A6A6ARQ4_9PLEO|nr:uncharacterized protein P153DRAFT_392498 [Dothidotthia symphoricarpi CBS 119687]KAF2133858.1 hypothetical protein P153DRAFT_392498 [Dothidotthia symphoricarpi CBS 119687]
MTLLQRLTSPPAQTLRVLQPTPATISYTVSTRPPRTTVPALLSWTLNLLTRLLLGLCALSLLWTKQRLAANHPAPLPAWLLSPKTRTRALALLATTPWRYLAPLALLVLVLVCRRPYTEESLTLLRGLGVQTSTTSATYLQTPTTRFIPSTQIQDIVIHEAFKGFEIRFYLAIVVQGERDVVVVFPGLLPRRRVLEEGKE